MRDVLEKMRECGKDDKMRDFPHNCGMVDTYGIHQITATANRTNTHGEELFKKNTEFII